MTTSNRPHHARGHTTTTDAVAHALASPTLPPTPSTPVTPSSSKKFPSHSLPRPVMGANMRRPSLPTLTTNLPAAPPMLKTARSNSSAHLLLPQATKPRSATLSAGSSPSGIVAPKFFGSNNHNACSNQSSSPVSLRQQEYPPSMIARPSPSSLASPRLASPSTGRFNNSNSSSSHHYDTGRTPQLDTTPTRRPSLSPRIGATPSSASGRFADSPKTLLSPRLGHSIEGRFSSEKNGAGTSLRPACSYATGSSQAPSGIPNASSLPILSSSAIPKSKAYSNSKSPTTSVGAPTLPGVGVAGLSAGTSTTTTTILTAAAAQTQTQAQATSIPACSTLSSPLAIPAAPDAASLTEPALSALSQPTRSHNSNERPAPLSNANRTTKSATIKPPSIVTKPTIAPRVGQSSFNEQQQPTPASTSSFSSTCLLTASSQGLSQSNDKTSLPPNAPIHRQGVNYNEGSSSTETTTQYPPIDPATPLSNNPSPSLVNINNINIAHNVSVTNGIANATSPPSTSPSLARSKNRPHAGVDSACFMTRSDSSDSMSTTSITNSPPGSASHSPTSWGHPQAMTPASLVTTTATTTTTMTNSTTLVGSGHITTTATTTASALPLSQQPSHSGRLRRQSSAPCLSSEKTSKPESFPLVQSAPLPALVSETQKCNCPPPLELPELVKQEMRREEEEHRKRECGLYSKIIELQIEVENLKGEKETLIRVVGRRDRSLETLQRQLEVLERLCRENDIAVDTNLCPADSVESWNFQEFDEAYQRILLTMQDLLRTGSKCLENARPLGSLLAGSTNIAAGGGGQERPSLQRSQSSTNVKAATALVVAETTDTSLASKDTPPSSVCNTEPTPRRALDDDDSRRQVLLAMGEPIDSLPVKAKDEEEEDDLDDEDEDGEESEFEELGEDMLKFAELQSSIMPRHESRAMSVSPSKMFPSPNLGAVGTTRSPLTPDIARTTQMSYMADHNHHYPHAYIRPRSRACSTHSRQSTTSNLLDDYFSASTPLSATHPSEIFPLPLPSPPAMPSSSTGRTPAPSRPLPPPPSQQQPPLTGLGIAMTTRSLSQSQLRHMAPPLPVPAHQQQRARPPSLSMLRSYSSNCIMSTSHFNNSPNSHRLSTASSVYSTATNMTSTSIGHRQLARTGSLPLPPNLPPQLPLPPIPTNSTPALSFRLQTKKQLMEPFALAHRSKQQQQQHYHRSVMGHGRTASHGMAIEQIDRFLRRKKITKQWTRELFNGGHRRRGSV